jgi:hypothetical protein
MAEVSLNGLMAITMTGNGMAIRGKDMGFHPIYKEISTRDFGKMIKKMAQVRLSMEMEISTSANSNMI